MKILCLFLSGLALLAQPSLAATINWSATTDNGFSLVNGTELPVGSLVRLGYFRGHSSGLQLTDAQIQASQGSPASLDGDFVEVASTTIGTGLLPSAAGHFAQSSTVDIGSTGKNVEGRQMYLWVFDNASMGSATQQAILYWSIIDTTTNPDGSADAPGKPQSNRMKIPAPRENGIDDNTGDPLNSSSLSFFP